MRFKSVNTIFKTQKLIVNSVEKKIQSGSIITQNSNKNKIKIKLLDNPLKGKKLF